MGSEQIANFKSETYLRKNLLKRNILKTVDKIIIQSANLSKYRAAALEKQAKLASLVKYYIISETPSENKFFNFFK